MKNYYIVFTLLLYFNILNSQTLEECRNILKKGIDLIDTGNYSKATEYLTKVEIMAVQNNWYEEQFSVNNCLALVYFYASDYGEAMNYYMKAYEIAIKHFPEEESTVLNNIVLIYLDEENYQKALDFQLKAYDIVKKGKDNIKHGVFAYNVAGVLNKLNRPKEAFTYLNEAFRYLKEKDGVYWVYGKIILAESYLKSGEVNMAIKTLEKEYDTSRALEESVVYSELVSMLAEAYQAKGNINKAILYAQEGLKEENDLSAKKKLYNHLASYNYQIKDYEKALKYKDTVLNISDSITKIKNTKLYENNKIKFDLQNYKNALENKQERLSLERIIYSSTLIITLILSFLIYRLFKIKWQKEKQQKEIIEHEQKIILLELEKEKNEHLLLEEHLKNVEKDALLEQEQLQNEIEQKNRALSAKALYLSGRNQMIEEIIISLKKLPSISNNETLKDQLRSLKQYLRSDNEWDNFIKHFEDVNQGWLTSLKELHPELNSNDIRFICYVYMNLNTKEICSIFNITPEACRKRRTRIAKKMNAPDGDTLYEYLSKLGV